MLRYPEQAVPTELHAWVDSDYAGDVITRKSTSGCVVMYGSHCLKTSSTVQEPIGLSSGESEFYAAVKGGATVLGIESLLKDWGVKLMPVLVLKTDSSAAKGFACRRGLGRSRHVSTRLLWLQDAVSRARLHIRKVGTKEQLGDFLTKPMSQHWLRDMLPKMGIYFEDGRARSQKAAFVASCG